MASRHRDSGFTLIELLVAVAVLTIIAAVALPLYRDYVETARDSALISSISTLEVFQEDLFLRTGAYGGGTLDVSAGTTTLTDTTGWAPQADDGATYVVDASAGTSYEVTVTDSSGYSICRSYPDRAVC